MPISRRRFLMGAGSIIGLGAVGATVVDVADHSLVERGLHHFGLVSSPDLHVPASETVDQSGVLDSRYMRAELGWSISQPRGSGELDGIIYCLHGKDGSHRTAFDDIHVPDATAFVGLRVAVAAVDGGADSYWHKRADGTDAMAMLLDEFVPMVRQRVGSLPQAMMGWSMGGYGSLLAAERARSEFVAIAPTSPALWTTPGATAPGAFDNPTDFYANDVFANLSVIKGMAVAVACGTGDPFYTTTRDLVSRMDFPHVAIYGPGFHDNGYWRSVAPSQLRSIKPAFA